MRISRFAWRSVAICVVLFALAGWGRFFHLGDYHWEVIPEAAKTSLHKIQLLTKGWDLSLHHFIEQNWESAARSAQGPIAVETSLSPELVKPTREPR